MKKIQTLKIVTLGWVLSLFLQGCAENGGDDVLSPPNKAQTNQALSPVGIDDKTTKPPVILGDWVEARSFATDKRGEDRDGFAGIEPVISNVPKTCTPAEKLIKRGPDCSNVKKADYNNTGDNTWVDVQVHVPRHREGQNLPVILHSHGWGGKKLEKLSELPECTESQKPYDCPLGENKGIESLLGMFFQAEKLLSDLVDKGYIVVSFTQRGFGKTEGDIMLVNPYHGTQDAIAVMDWIAMQGKKGNLPVEVDENNDFTVATMGGSYGGGFQLPLAALDKRIDAMVPIGTWNNLTRALVPNGATKGGWGNMLCIVAAVSPKHPYLADACTGIANPFIRTQKAIDPSGKMVGFLDQNGLSYFETLQKNGEPFRDGEQPFVMRPVDALLIQGLRDVLFPMQEAVENYNYLKAAGGDVRVMSNQSGHINPAANQYSSGTNNCGNLDMLRTIRVWLDVKLRGKPTALLNGIPQVCLSLDNKQAVNLDMIPSSDNTEVEWAAFETSVGNFRQPSKCTIVKEIDNDTTVLAGNVNLRNFNVKDDTLIKTGVAYMALCLERDGKTTLIDDMVTGYVPGQYDETRTFMVVAEKLQKGDKIGVMSMKEHIHMYLFGPTLLPNFSALLAQGFKPGEGSGAEFVDKTLPGAKWMANGMLSVNAFTVKGEVALPLLTDVTVSEASK